MYGAGDGIRTRDPNLGKVVLYQLSYTRNSLTEKMYQEIYHNFNISVNYAAIKVVGQFVFALDHLGAQ